MNWLIVLVLVLNRLIKVGNLIFFYLFEFFQPQNPAPWPACGLLWPLQTQKGLFKSLFLKSYFPIKIWGKGISIFISIFNIFNKSLLKGGVYLFDLFDPSFFPEHQINGIKDIGKKETTIRESRHKVSTSVAYVSFNTWLISSWEECKCCYKLRKCTKLSKLSFWVKIVVIL